jgi:hypothetical protein
MSESNGYMTPDQISFYDEVLKKQIEGSYRYDGKAIYVASQVYGARSARTRFDGPFHQIAVDLLAQKLLSELARDAEKVPAESHSHKKAA